jgi:hypothetical protein
VSPRQRAAVKSPLIGPGQAFSPGIPEAQGERKGRFLDFSVPQDHVVARNFEAGSEPVPGVSFGCQAKGGKERQVSSSRNRGVFLRSHAFCQGLNHPGLDPAYVLSRHGTDSFFTPSPKKTQKRRDSCPFFELRFPD